MNATLVVTQAILTWTLLGILLTWMTVFAILAFRPDPSKNPVPDEFSTAPGPLGVSTAPRLRAVGAHQPLQTAVVATRSHDS